MRIFFSTLIITLLLLVGTAFAGDEEDKKTVQASQDPVVTLQTQGRYSLMIVENVLRGDPSLSGRPIQVNWGDSEPTDGLHWLVMMSSNGDGSYTVHPDIRYKGHDKVRWMQVDVLEME